MPYSLNAEGTQYELLSPQLYTPIEEERLLVPGVGRRPLPRMAALMHLKRVQTQIPDRAQKIARDDGLHR